MGHCWSKIIRHLDPDTITLRCSVLNIFLSGLINVCLLRGPLMRVAHPVELELCYISTLNLCVLPPDLFSHRPPSLSVVFPPLGFFWAKSNFLTFFQWGGGWSHGWSVFPCQIGAYSVCQWLTDLLHNLDWGSFFPLFSPSFSWLVFLPSSQSLSYVNNFMVLATVTVK